MTAAEGLRVAHFCWKLGWKLCCQKERGGNKKKRTRVFKCANVCKCANEEVCELQGVGGGGGAQMCVCVCVFENEWEITITGSCRGEERRPAPARCCREVFLKTTLNTCWFHGRLHILHFTADLKDIVSVLIPNNIEIHVTMQWWETYSDHLLK